MLVLTIDSTNHVKQECYWEGLCLHWSGEHKNMKWDMVKLIQGSAIECDEFQIAVLINWVAYKKHKKLQSVSSKMPFNICPVLKNYIS